MCNLFRLCRKDEISFDIVAKTGKIAAKNGNNVDATFDFVVKIVRLVAFDNVASILLLVWTGLYAAAEVLYTVLAYNVFYSLLLVASKRTENVSLLVLQISR